MSTPGSNDSTVVLGDLAHTDLITRLVAEAYSEFGRVVSPPAIPSEFPSAPAAIPPVHPAATPATPQPPRPTSAPATDSPITHPFGEPRCHNNLLQSKKSETKTINVKPLVELSRGESFATPPFYFLRSP